MMKENLNLRQHTPIIQFQYYQPGATLRASELKPKIDKFVREELEHIDPKLFLNHEKLIKSNFSEEKVPSKYKVSIKATQARSKPTKYATFISREECQSLTSQGLAFKYPAPYFGDYPAVWHNDVRVEIFSFDDELAEFLKKVIPYVLAYNNFGSRQSKGFGCFLPTDMKQPELEQLFCKRYKTFWKADIGNNDPFRVINKTYQLIKGGTNYPVYHKSELFKYMCKEDIRWEKHKIKTELEKSYPDIFRILKYDTRVSTNRIADCPAPDDKIEHRYIRAMLGLAENNEYIMVKPNNLNIEKLQIRIKDKKGTIERFRSPITFKVIDRCIYILPEPEAIGKEMLGRDFEFILETKKMRGPSPTPIPLFTIKTPDRFELVDFLKTALPNINAITKDNWQIKECKS